MEQKIMSLGVEHTKVEVYLLLFSKLFNFFEAKSPHLQNGVAIIVSTC